MSETAIIGVDHGYAAMKTAHCSFPSGLVDYEHEPYTLKDVLEYEGKYYVVGSGRQPLQKDKTRTTTFLPWPPSPRNSPVGARIPRRKSIWRQGCRSPASGGIRSRFGSICTGVGSRCPSAMKGWTIP